MKKIIILEEELFTQMQLYLALCDKYCVEIAVNLESAMYLLRKINPEILLFDYNMDQFKNNGKSGLKFLKKVKKKYNHLKVIPILNPKDKVLESEIQKNGADDILYKPIKNRRLISSIKQLSNNMN